MTTLTHGMTGTTTFKSWQSMKERCSLPSNRSYVEYGAVGIVVCDRWRNSFQAFLDDMGPRPEGKTLDRIDGSKGYEPGNCRWATPLEQVINRKMTHWIEAFGQRRTLTEWAMATGLSRSGLLERLNKGMPPEAALSLPSRKRRSAPKEN